MVSWGQGATGAISGAAAGSAFGPIGAGIGGTIGGLAGLFGGGGRADRARKFPRLTPEQMQLQNQLIASLQGGGGAFSDMLGPFNPQLAQNAYQQAIYGPAMRNWQQNIMPGIQERFADQGASSALYNSLAAAGRDLQENLGAQMSPFIYQAMMQNQQNRLGALNTALGTQSFTPYVKQGYASPFSGMMEGFSGGLGQMMGAQIGNRMMSQFPVKLGNPGV